MADEIEGADQGGADLMIGRSGDVVILTGPSELVERFVAGDPTLSDRRPVEAKGPGASEAIAAIGALVGAAGTRQLLFELDPAGAEAFARGALAKMGDGWFRTQIQAAKLGSHVGMRAVEFGPQQALSAQLALTTLALTMAIKDVQQAVERVEDKVDELQDLLQSERVGTTVGTHRNLTRRCEALDFHGTMSVTDWNAVDGVGISIEQQIEGIRSFVRKRLLSAEAEGQRIGGRRDALEDVRELSEVLGLLVVAQDSLFLFQQLRLIHIRDTEPHHLEAAAQEARALVAKLRTEDQALLDQVRSLAADRVTVKALEIHRFMAARSLVAAAAEVDELLAWFAHQRGLTYEAIEIPDIPEISEAVDELQERGGALVAGGKEKVGSLVRRMKGDDEKEQTPELTEGESITPALEPGDPTDDLSNLTKVTQKADRVKARLLRRGTAQDED